MPWSCIGYIVLENITIINAMCRQWLVFASNQLHSKHETNSMKKIKWFLGEFFVVVAGVLVAFGLNGYYNKLQDNDKERAYLIQIDQDLTTSIEMQEMAIEHQRNSVLAGSMVLRAAYSDTIPEKDVVLRNMLRFMQFSAGSQVSPTLSSLVSTGDLQLIKDDSLRIVLGKMSSLINAHISNMEHISYQWLIPSYERFSDEINIADLRLSLMSSDTYAMLANDSLQGIPPANQLVALPELNIQALLSAPSFRQEATKFFIAQQNLYQQEMYFLSELKVAQELLQQTMKRMEMK